MNNKLGFLPGYISWLTIVFAFLAIVTFFAVSDPSVQYATRMGFGGGGGYSEGTKAVPPTLGGVPMMDSGVTNSAGGMTRPDYYPYPSPDVPVTDTREFLKIYYNAAMQTRDVPALTRRVETTVRGYDGRIDNESSADKYGYVSFALPQAKYDAFRAELESLVGSRFLKVNISSQNLLSQKVSIEEQQKQADQALADYTTARQKLVAAHANIVQSLEAQIADANTTADAKTQLQLQLAKENSSYTRNLSNADANIKYAQNWVKGVKTQDATLLANVATVNGTVSIQWIRLWDMALLYLPGYWIPTIFALLTLLSFTSDRRAEIFNKRSDYKNPSGVV
ncbi:MAG: DUF4349 domain-containing protein [Candidatus Pacebacteria bacterium]|nr:DUF4349 domain-containing protein [Candidatus Paceibacterota bacterium]